MDENKMENIQASMKYYCRVCTTNTKAKKTKPEECIWIFKKTGLKSILEKYLQLQITEDDPLPKVICKACYEKIEAIEFLRVIARRTEALLRDFLRKKELQEKTHSQFQSAYKSFAIAQTTPRQTANDDEVVVNVSLSDPLTKDINKKLMVAQRKKESLDKAFTPAQVNRRAVTSSPNFQPPAHPVTIVHQMPRKKVQSVPTLVEKRKNLQMALTNATTVTLEIPPPHPGVSPVKLPLRAKMVADSTPPLRHISEAPAIPQKIEIHPVISANTHTLGQGVPLGSIIKDEDLLRLILKALKWPVNNQTLDLQIQRLKNTNFSDIIVDPNLLQDTDLIQILGPLIHPTLVPIAVMPQQQSYQINIPPDQPTVPPSTISYKLPAETSVQIITVPPEEKVAGETKPSQRPSTSGVRNVNRKRPRFVPVIPKPITSNVIVVSDESDDEVVRELTAVENVQVQLDPAMYPGIGENSNSNEAMLATLNRQREAMMRMHRIKRKQSLMPSNVEMVDDIMIVDEGVQMNESYPEVVLVKKPRKAEMMPPAVPSTSAGIFPAKPVTIVEAPKKLPTQSTSTSLPAVQASTPGPIAKLPTLPTQKLPTLPLKKIPLLDGPKAPAKRESLLHRKPFASSCPIMADADSTTKIVIKESKVQKPPQAHQSTDIEEQIIKVRIGKPTQKSETSNEEGECKKKLESSSEEEVVIVVEYEENTEEGAKVTEQRNEEEEDSVLEVRQEDIVPSPEAEEGDNEGPHTETSKSPALNEFEIPPVEIKEEDEPEVAENKTDEGRSIKEEKPTNSEDRKDTTIDSKQSLRSFVASKTSPMTDSGRQTRSTHKRRQKQNLKPVVQPKKEDTKPVVAATFRPARRSKTLSKYYKGPPASGPAGRSMRSRT